MTPTAPAASTRLVSRRSSRTVTNCSRSRQVSWSLGRAPCWLPRSPDARRMSALGGGGESLLPDPAVPERALGPTRTDSDHLRGPSAATANGRGGDQRRSGRRLGAVSTDRRGRTHRTADLSWCHWRIPSTVVLLCAPVTASTPPCIVSTAIRRSVARAPHRDS